VIINRALTILNRQLAAITAVHRKSVTSLANTATTKRVAI
jgi:hypothetical protein